MAAFIFAWKLKLALVALYSNFFADILVWPIDKLPLTWNFATRAFYLIVGTRDFKMVLNLTVLKALLTTKFTRVSVVDVICQNEQHAEWLQVFRQEQHRSYKTKWTLDAVLDR